jgi:thiol-disulfide isomerase/thioredoxin
MHIINPINDTDINKLNNLMEKNISILFFLHPGCGYCKELKPVITQIEGDLTDTDGLLAKINYDKKDDMKYKREINGYPTISVFKDGKYNKEDYTGSRDYESLKQFMSDIYNQGNRKSTLIKSKTFVKKPFKSTLHMKKNIDNARKKRSTKFWQSFSKKFRKKARKEKSKKIWKNLSTNLSKVVKSMKKNKKSKKKSKKKTKKKTKKKSMEGGRRRKRRRSKSKKKRR